MAVSKNKENTRRNIYFLLAIIVAVVLGLTASQTPLVQRAFRKVDNKMERKNKDEEKQKKNAKKEKEVDITASGFTPATLKVKAGTEVDFENEDTAQHSVVADDGRFVTGVIDPDEGKEVTFDTTGTYTYHDELNPQLKGTIVVE